MRTNGIGDPPAVWMRTKCREAQGTEILTFAEFMAGEIAEAVVSGVFVGFAECGVIEDLFDEFVDGKAFIQDHHSDVNELGGGLADHADAEEFAIGPRKDELQKASGVSGDMAAGVVFIKSAADTVVDSLLFAGFFSFAGGGDFRNGVNAHGKEARHALFVFEAEGVADSDASLFHGCGGEGGKT